MRISLFILLLVLSSSFLAGQAHFCVKIAGSATEQAGKMATLQNGKSFQCGTSAGSLQLNASNESDDKNHLKMKIIMEMKDDYPFTVPTIRIKNLC